MTRQNEFDVAIVGGGLSGLAASIQLARKGYSVALFEKEKYPFHKVCGEYVSLESKPFLNSLGVDTDALRLPFIDTLHLTSPGGKEFITKLPLGGFGISRYKLDSCLADIAARHGVHLFQNTKVEDIKSGGNYIIHFLGQSIRAKICCGAYGKRSNLDIKWKRKFISDENHRLNNYVGVKYHVQTDGETNVIGLHNFKNGYCGISKIEEEKYCLCYMTKAENLKASGNSIEQMQKKILFQNPHLERIFQSSRIIDGFPVVISQISFSKKTKTENGVLMLGDTAGMIAPLCGNGMSIALHSSKIAAHFLDAYLQNKISKEQLLHAYEKEWLNNFSSRLRTGRVIQSFFGRNALADFFVGTFKIFPFLAKPVIRLTHGKPF